MSGNDKFFGLMIAGWQRLSWPLIMVWGVGIFFLRNLMLPLLADDYSYAFIWDGADRGNLLDDIGPLQRIETFSDIISSQWAHYFTWGGRVPALFTAQFFIWQGDGSRFWFSIANALVFAGLALVLYWLSAGRLESPGKHKGSLLWIFFALFFVVPTYIYTMLWLTGAVVYLWTALAECLFLLPYALAYWQKDFWLRSPPWRILLMCLAGLLAGWSEEGGSIATVLLAAALLWLLRFEGGWRLWMKAGMVSLLLGCLLLLAAPGTFHRLQLMEEYESDYTIPPELIGSATMFLYNFAEGFWPVFSAEIVLLLPILFYWRRCSPDKKSSRYVAIFTLGGFLVLSAMMFSPEFHSHGGFHSVIFLTIASAAALRKAWPRLGKVCLSSAVHRSSTMLLVLLVAVGWFLATIGCLVVENSYHDQWAKRLEYIKTVDDKEEIINVPAIVIPGGLDWILGNRSVTENLLNVGGDLESDPTDNRSNVFAQYYGLKGIVIDRTSCWGKYGELIDW